jgi:hypothetical protein
LGQEGDLGMNVEIELSPEQIADLEHAFTLSDLKKEALAQALLPLAVNAWLDWLSNKKRYNSLTEQYTDWIYEMYERLLPNETPSASQLHNCFHVPYGQAQYIARVLNNRDIPRLRERALEDLKTALSARKDAIYKRYEKEPERAQQKCYIKMVKRAADRLIIITENLNRESPEDVDLLSRSGSTGDFVMIGITVRTFMKVWERLSIKDDE